ncbi:hypothetical protein TVAG_414100 [Trichomonas vaginalis G3]|uniref:Uncharacterized protein n=2 Tax=Trichomonas vaginalis TaxID=5722 RepID=A2EC82_TRIV3|nr:hypothetical protein TVAGG3_0205600 [Trichomonas vaginalis G3]EAY09759.1 hypothetical protein TVAG_414100 [Trichomonas vaginalis G3]KAI5550917.1 hypothetical protein TVAGG3_0205600 [Trichomonas vaginalis G3]|eukprot:XP_001321982.1 hypothetical protein [Trichomonas vaginalis G3]
MSLRASPAASSARTMTPTLKQYKLEDAEDSQSDESEIEVCVDTIFVPDTEDLCCQMLQSKYLKQKYMGLWKIKLASRSTPVFDKDEFESIKEQSNRNASVQQRHQRHKFLSQYSNIARISLDKLLLSRLFSRWLSRFEQIRIKKIQEGFAETFSQRRMKEKALHKLRTSFMRTVDNAYDEASRDASQVQPNNRIKELIAELDRTTKENIDLQNEIDVKTERLKELQSQLQDITDDDREAEKRLQQVQSQTDSIQASLVETERKYQEEIATLRTQLSLVKAGNNEELERIKQEVDQQNADRMAASAFVDAAMASAQAEFEEQSEKLKAAENIVKNFQELLQAAKDRADKLEQSRKKMAADLESLKIRKKHLEVSKASSLNLAQEKEDRIKERLSKAKEDLTIAMNKVEVQNEQIQSQRDEIRMLQDQIQKTKAQTEQLRMKFIGN